MKQDLLTCWDDDVGSYTSPSEDESPCLALLSPKSIHRNIDYELGRNLNGSKDKLGHVHAQAKACDVHAHAIVGKGHPKPEVEGDKGCADRGTSDSGPDI